MCESTPQIPMMKSLMSGLTGLFVTGGWQLKKVAYAIIVLSSMVWLSVDLRHGISDAWVRAYSVLMFSTTGGYLIGKKIAQGGTK